MQHDTSREIARLDGRCDGIEIKLTEREKSVHLAREVADRALSLATSSQQRVNETLERIPATFALKADMDKVADDVQELEKGGARGEGRMGGIHGVQDFIFRVMPLLFSLVTLILLLIKLK